MTPFRVDQASTPLTPDEIAGLIPTHISLRQELDQLEHANLLEADLWAFRRRRSDLLSERFLLRLHRRMFGHVWRWAGAYRKSPRNLGVAAWRIQTDVHLLLDDSQFWQANNSYSRDELATRFHHRLVAIHPFVNGNGRHSRLMADLILFYSASPRFTWGSASLMRAGDTRANYIAALKRADEHDYAPLIRFARS